MAPTNLRKRRTTTTVVGITERSHGGRYGPFPLTEYPLANLVLHPVGSYTRRNTDTSHDRAVPRGDSMAKGVLLVMTEPLPGKEDEFNDWYSNVHLHELVKVPGIAAAQRFEAVPWSNGAVPASATSPCTSSTPTWKRSRRRSPQLGPPSARHPR